MNGVGVTLGPPRRRVLGDPDALPADVRAARAALPVALVSMPFVAVGSPSLQLGTLAPIARSHGFPVEVASLFLDFAAVVGADVGDALAAATWPTGDWLFSLEAFGPDAPDPAGRFLVDYPVRRRRPDDDVADLGADELLALRHEVVPRFLDAVVAEGGWERFRVVGLTSTFQQSAASFALARRLTSHWPDLVVVAGGANFDGPMGPAWLRAVPALDHVVSGEGEHAVVGLLDALARGVDPAEAGIPGVLSRRGGEVVGRASEPLERMDELPVPDYDEWFARAERLGLLPLAARRGVPVPFEGARGCWWGEKRHCTFCGLNGATMRFRAKSPARLLDELGALASRHRSFELVSVDSILDPRFLDEVAPRLTATDVTLRLFYEVKASLGRDEVRRLRAAGVTAVQPGIESLSSRVLGLMRKGTRASTNVNLLRWCRHHGVAVHWNLLWGFPDERAEHYDEQAGLIPAVAHLEPAVKEGPIAVERFSPLFEDREAFPARALRPAGALSYVYPSAVDLADAAYDFECEWEAPLPSEAHARVAAAMAAWREAWRSPERPSLVAWTSPGVLHLDDRRPAFPLGTHAFEGPLAAAYQACMDRPVKADAVREGAVPGVPLAQVVEALDGFCERGLMMRDGNLFLALAVPATGGTPYERDGDR